MTNHDHDPQEPRPIDSVEWKGSRADIYDGIERESAQGTVIIYDRSDFATPIERVQILSVLDSYEDLGNEYGVRLVGNIQIDRSLNPVQHREFLRKFGQNFKPFSDKDDELRFQKTPWPNIFVIAHPSGVKTLVSITPEGDHVRIANDVLMTNTGGMQIVKVLPQSLESMDANDSIKGFMPSFMRTVDFCSGLLNVRPQDAKLKRVYPVGREMRPYKAPSVAPDAGRMAVKGSRRPSKPRETQHSVEELGIELTEDKITLDDVGGLHYVKSALRDIVVSFNNIEIMEKWGAKRPQGVLLYGEPGTGKTMLAQALANELGAEMWAIQSTDIHEKWLGESERHIKEIFNRAKSVDKPTVIFFDEFESIIGITEDPSPGGADNARNAVAGIFKQEMNTLTSINPNVLVVAATNDLDKIDPSLIRSGRFDHKVYVPMPDVEARQEIISSIISKTMLRNESGEFKIFADDLEVPEIAELTDGMSGADITEIFRRIGMKKAMEEARTSRSQEPISQAEIKQSITDFKQIG
jgi:ATP-dependent 26S proteasome regulatory subunit